MPPRRCRADTEAGPTYLAHNLVYYAQHYVFFMQYSEFGIQYFGRRRHVRAPQRGPRWPIYSDSITVEPRMLTEIG